MGYSKKFKLKHIMYVISRGTSISKTAKKKKIPKQTLARWIKQYHIFGNQGLENQKPGVKEVTLGKDIELLILKLWKERQRSVYSMRRTLKNRDYNISERQIKKVYKKYKLSQHPFIEKLRNRLN